MCVDEENKKKCRRKIYADGNFELSVWKMWWWKWKFFYFFLMLLDINDVDGKEDENFFLFYLGG